MAEFPVQAILLLAVFLFVLNGIRLSRSVRQGSPNTDSGDPVNGLFFAGTLMGIILILAMGATYTFSRIRIPGLKPEPTTIVNTPATPAAPELAGAAGPASDDGKPAPTPTPASDPRTKLSAN